jgi:CheY-like chemotaxis protein
MPNPRSILLADDDTEIRRLFSAVLAGAGFQVIEAANGFAAMETALVRSRANPPQPTHGLVTDVVMPEMDGVLLASLCKELYEDIAIVIVSGFAEVTLPRSLEGAEFLRKPFTPEALVNALYKSLGEQPFEYQRSAA